MRVLVLWDPHRHFTVVFVRNRSFKPWNRPAAGEMGARSRPVSCRSGGSLPPLIGAITAWTNGYRRLALGRAVMDCTG